MRHLLFALFLSGIVACRGQDSKPLPSTSPAPEAACAEPAASAAAASPPRLPNDLATRTTIACGMTKLPSVAFAVDDARVSVADEVKLGLLAQCLAREATNAVVVLVGHADPSGPEDHNLTLGLERARAVKATLARHGLADDRIAIASSGETAIDREKWSSSRRVDLLLSRP